MLVIVTILPPEGSREPFKDADVGHMRAVLADHGMLDISVGPDLSASMQVEAASLSEAQDRADQAYVRGFPM